MQVRGTSAGGGAFVALMLVVAGAVVFSVGLFAVIVAAVVALALFVRAWIKAKPNPPAPRFDGRPPAPPVARSTYRTNFGRRRGARH